MFIESPIFSFTTIDPSTGVIVKLIKPLGFRSVAVTKHVSTSYPFVRDVILIESAAYKVGGEKKLLIWKENVLPEAMLEENSEDAKTVKLLKLPEQAILV